jgi:two-component system response regulator NreC
VTVTVLICDDHAVVREGLRLILAGEAGIDVVGEASDVEGVRRALAEHAPDVLLLDINLGGESALSRIPELRREAPGTAIVVLTMQKEPFYAREALEGGATGYVLKESAASELVRAIRAAAAGETYLQPELGGALLNPQRRDRSEPLSKRELEVLRLIGLGHTNSEISAKLFLSVRTVESHRARIHEKLGVTGRAELVRYALDHGLIDS